MRSNSLSLRSYGAVRCLIVVLVVVGSTKSSAQEQGVADQPRSKFETIAGRVLTGDGIPVSGSMVAAFEQASGIPAFNKTGRVISMQQLKSADDFDGLLAARTDESGRFELKVAPGRFRLVAQTWLDNSDVENLLAVNGSRIRLDGVLENVESTSAEEVPQVTIKPIGNATVRIDLSIGNSDTLLVVSRNRLAGDPILGFAVWSGGFWNGIIGGNRMPKGDTTVSGLPSANIQFALFANDNNPGFGGVQVELTDNETRDLDIPIIASWSDGHKTPPKRLEELVKFMGEHPQDMSRIEDYVMARIERMDEQRPNISEYWVRLAPLLADEFKLSDSTTVTVADGLAAMAYVRLAKYKR